MQFAMLRLETAPFDIEHEIEIATVRLLAIVAERTSGEDAWYWTFYRALAWYLQSGGMADAKLEAALDGAVRGQFHSWSLPSDEQIAAAGSEFGRMVGL